MEFDPFTPPEFSLIPLPPGCRPMPFHVRNTEDWIYYWVKWAPNLTATDVYRWVAELIRRGQDLYYSSRPKLRELYLRVCGALSRPPVFPAPGRPKKSSLSDRLREYIDLGLDDYAVVGRLAGDLRRPSLAYVATVLRTLRQ